MGRMFLGNRRVHGVDCIRCQVGTTIKCKNQGKGSSEEEVMRAENEHSQGSFRRL